MSEMEDPKVNDLIQSLNKINVFGPPDFSAIQSLASEKREQEKRLRKEEKKRKKEWEESERRKKEQEEEDHMFALREQKRLDSYSYDHTWRFSAGRGVPPSNMNSVTSIGFRRPPPMETLIADQIDKFAGGGKIHRPMLQNKVWQEDFMDECEPNLTNLPSTSADNITDLPSGDLNSEPAFIYYEGESSSPAVEADESVSSGCSSAAPSPVPVILDKNRYRPPRSRLAAKFPNTNLVGNENDSYVSNNEFFAQPRQDYRLAVTSRPGGVPFNSLSASQRVMGDSGIRSEDLRANYARYVTSGRNNFVLDQTEFPPL